jgi:hypothetical protein
MRDTAGGNLLRGGGHRRAGTWLDLELDLWEALANTVKQWGRKATFE